MQKYEQKFVPPNITLIFHIFDLQGREVSGTQKGVLIRRQGSEVKKVMVK